MNIRNVSSVLMMLVTVMVATSTAQDLTDVKCIVRGEPANLQHAAEYRQSNVYFCCPECVETFEADPAKYSTEANHQLVLTGQFVQTQCPITEQSESDGTTTEFMGVEIGLANQDAKDQFESVADIQQQIAMVFGELAFEKSFQQKAAFDLTNAKCLIIPGRGVKSSLASDYGDKKVFFCCGSCQKKYDADPVAFSTQANLQLFSTGQAQQTACPISGTPISDAQTVEVDGQQIGFCCEHCKAKVDNAADDDARRELVFGEEGFAKGFSTK